MRVFLITLFLLCSSHSLADGNSFLSNCKLALKVIDGELTNGQLVGAGLCMGKIQGMRNMNSFYEFQLDKKNVYFCVPQKAKTSQLIRVVVKYLEERPASLHEDEFGLIFSTLTNAYPCN